MGALRATASMCLTSCRQSSTAAHPPAHPKRGCVNSPPRRPLPRPQRQKSPAASANAMVSSHQAPYRPRAGRRRGHSSAGT